MRRILFLLMLFVFVSATFAGDVIVSKELSEEEQIRFNNTCSYVLAKGTFITKNDATFRDLFNFLQQNNFTISQFDLQRIDNSGGSWLKATRYCQIIERSKLNPKIIRVKLIKPFTGAIVSNIWTHEGYLMTRAEYKSNRL